MQHKTDDLRIRSLHPLISPEILIEEIPLTKKAIDVVTAARQAASNIINKKDKRLLVIAGPCSIHDVNAAMEYGHLMAQAVKKYQKELCIIMRVYFEKPRTTIGWKGLINDPYLNNSFKINH